MTKRKIIGKGVFLNRIVNFCIFIKHITVYLTKSKYIVFALGISIGLFVSVIFFFISRDNFNIAVEKVKIEGVNISEIKTPDNPDDFSDVDLSDFWSSFRILEDYYVPAPITKEEQEDSEKHDLRGIHLTRQERIDWAISGLASSFNDPYTDFFPPQEAEDFSAEVIEGEVSGIGAWIERRDGMIHILNVIRNSPAEKAGLKAGDIILEVDGIDVDGFSASATANRIRGKKGTQVDLKIFRPTESDELEISPIRDIVKIDSITTKEYGDVFVITMSSFTKDTPKDFIRALQKFSSSTNSKSLIIDLRDNSGGILEVALYTSGLFVDKDLPILYKYSGTEEHEVFKSTTNSVLGPAKFPITILVNKQSASASEIFAEILRHYKVADIVGERTFGKGSVQQIMDLKNGGSLKITIAHWLTPAKESISDEGVKPDVDFVKDGIEDSKDRNRFEGDLDKDPFLKRAIDHVRSRI